MKILKAQIVSYECLCVCVCVCMFVSVYMHILITFPFYERISTKGKTIFLSESAYVLDLDTMKQVLMNKLKESLDCLIEDDFRNPPDIPDMK